MEEHYNNDEKLEFPTNQYDLDNEYEAEPLFIMNVELEEGKSQPIKIFSNSKPEELAFEFCKNNNLDIGAMTYLVNQISTLLDELNPYEYENKQGRSIGTDINDCIQEVDEEETETRKSNFSNTQTPNSILKPQSHKSNESDLNNNVRQLNPEGNSPNNTLAKDGGVNDISSVYKFLVKSNNSNNQNNEINLNKDDQIYINISNDHNLNLNHSEEILIKEYSEVPIYKKQKSPINIYTAKNTNINLKRNNDEAQTTNELINNYEIDNSDSYKIDENKDMNMNILNNIKSEEKYQERPLSHQVFYENFKKNQELKTKISRKSNKKIDTNNKINISNQSSTNRKLFVRNFMQPTSLFEKLIKIQEENSSNNSTYNENPKFSFSHVINREKYLNTSFRSNSKTFIHSTKENNNESKNYGERLYKRGLEMRQLSLRKMENFRIEKEIENLRICTFKPQVNNLTISQLKKKILNKKICNKQQYTLNYNLYLDDKLKLLKNKHEKKVDMSFMNKTNAENSFQSMIVTNFSPSLQKSRIYDSYKNAKIIPLNIDQLTKKMWSFRFKPVKNTKNIKQNYILSIKKEKKKSSSKKQLVASPHSTDNNYSQAFSKSIQHFSIQPIKNTKIDKKENPSNSTNHRSNDKLIINQYMFSYAKKYQSSQSKNSKELGASLNKISDSSETTNHSDLTFSKKKDEVSRKFFKILDQDTSLISFSNENNHLNSNIIDIIIPKELKEGNESLNEAELKSLEHLLELRDDEKNYLLTFEKKEDKKCKNYNFTFFPQTQLDNNQGSMIVRNIRNHSSKII